MTVRDKPSRSNKTKSQETKGEMLKAQCCLCRQSHVNMKINVTNENPKCKHDKAPAPIQPVERSHLVPRPSTNQHV